MLTIQPSFPGDSGVRQIQEEGEPDNNSGRVASPQLGLPEQDNQL
jgi:hypothetical protein